MRIKQHREFPQVIGGVGWGIKYTRNTRKGAGGYDKTTQKIPVKVLEGRIKHEKYPRGCWRIG